MCKRTIVWLLLLVFFNTGLNAQITSRLTGKVLDENSNPIRGASIRLLNTNSGVVSDNDGSFTIPDVFNGKYLVQVSAVGYATISNETVVNGTGSNLVVTLYPNVKQLDEVVVSVQKREELLQRSPLSVTALSSKQVQDYRLWNIRDVTAISPNMYAADPGDKRNVTSIRGITTTSYDPAVATYVDGVNQFSLDTYISQLSDIERIEVLRGPQGTLYGRNAMGGVVNIITRQPTNKTDGFAEVNFGNYGQQRYALGIRTPIIKDKLFVGISGLFDKFNGYYTNKFNNSKYDKQHSTIGNYYVKYLPAKHWDLTLNVKHNSNRNNGPFPLVVGVADAFNEPFVLSQNATTKLVDNIFNTSFSINHTGRYFNFTSQSSYQSDYRYYTRPIDADFSPIDGIELNYNFGRDWNNVKVLSQEFRFTSSPASTSPISWSAGTYLFYQDNPVKQATHFGKDAQLVGSPDVNYSLINTTRAKGSGVAVYGQATYRISDKLDITGGLRYDREHKKQSVLGEYQKDPNPVTLFDYRPDTSANANFSAFSPKLGFNFKVNQQTIVFANYTKGFRAGGLTPLASDPSQPALFAFEPEHSNNIELGIKNQLMANRLNINVTAFYTRVSNTQVPTLVLPEAVTITRNTGRLNSKGIEAEVNANLIKGLEVNYSFGYTSAKYLDLKLSQNGGEVNLKGNRQIFTPETTSMLAAQYTLALDARHGVNLVVRGEWRYLGTQFFDLANNIRQSPYNIYNTRLGVTAKHLSLFVWGRNLADKRYISYAYDFGAVHLGDPRTYGVTIATRL
ncbi:TonB-dependent receptor [Segetibacter sp. 3557_3]|uniref:TonB-dependent receptor n=1 Tax=Segetibacter sp. 3557_3 TaxID=2547429 RepID=UPI0010591F04|nr:TonB-dependent receptor [Segetibacter sp. 3557_3]TDH19951.1 TonB-dependent receptor [Segetibacter sp. 3557_3]